MVIERNVLGTPTSSFWFSDVLFDLLIHAMILLTKNKKGVPGYYDEAIPTTPPATRVPELPVLKEVSWPPLP